MTELISKWDVVDKLTALENEFQQFKPFEGFEHAMYRKLCELEMEIGKTPGISNGVTVQEWISVKDRLPEESGMYIVTANDGHAQRVSFVLWQKRNKAWNLTGARSYWRVTHWQPMPQPPKGE